MRVVAGTCRGTGAILNVCIGFVPDFVNIYNFGDAGTEFPFTVWNKFFSTDAELEGFSNVWSDMDAFADHTQAEGIQPHYGGVLMNSTTQPSITYGNAGVDYVTWDDVDYRYTTNKGPYPRTDALINTIDTWTTDTGASYTGKFNADVTGTICIAGNWYTITVLTASQGSADDEVQLSMTPVGPAGRTLTSAAITHISGMYGSCGYPVARNDYSKPGFKMAAISTVNTAAEMFMFEAGTYDTARK
jgi:hypothetical protein